MDVRMQIIHEFTGKWSAISKYLAKKEWLGLYNKSCKVFNSNIDACNAAFDRTYGSVDLSKDAKMMSVYNKFVADWMNPLVESVKNKRFQVRYDQTDGWFRLVQRKRPDNKMTFSMKQI